MTYTRFIPLAALLIIAAARVSFAVACGDTIDGSAILDADLNCSSDPALTVNDGGSLDMNGFTVTCNATDNGIVLGAGAKLKNGAVGNCAFIAITLNGDGHKLNGIYVFDSDTGLHASPSNKNKISNSSFSNAVIYVAGNGNSLSGIVAANGNTPIYLFGDGNKLSGAYVRDSTNVAISVEGQKNKISNVVMANSEDGLKVDGSYAKASNIVSVDHTGSGIVLSGFYSKLSKCSLITAGGGNGLVVYGDDNTISGCRTLRGYYGIDIEGRRNQLSKNKVFGADNGIYANDDQNVISGNSAVGSTYFDLKDSTCLQDNVWSDNTGSKKNGSCIQ